jgi:hypothetical protein
LKLQHRRYYANTLLVSIIVVFSLAGFVFLTRRQLDLHQTLAESEQQKLALIEELKLERTARSSLPRKTQPP